MGSSFERRRRGIEYGRLIMDFQQTINARIARQTQQVAATAGVTKVNGKSGEAWLSYTDVNAAPASSGVTNGDLHDHFEGDGAQIDHGTLAGLADDDHSQYHNDTRGDLRYVQKNAGITAGTKTKITYDAKGLVTGGTDATTADITDTTDKRYCTEAEKATWNGKQDALTYTPENVANKSTSAVLGTSDTQYPSQKAVKSYVDNIYANYDDPENPILRPIITTDDMVITVGSGKDFATIQEAINAVPMFVNHNVNINIYSGTYNEVITIKNFQGSGTLTVNVVDGETVTITRFVIVNCLCHVVVAAGQMPATTFTASGETAEKTFNIDRCNSVTLSYFSDTTTDGLGTGVHVLKSNIFIGSCTISNKLYGIRALYSNVTISGVAGTGNNTAIAYYASVVMESSTNTITGTNTRNPTGSLFIPVSGIAIDTDGALAADSDGRVATQKATKAYVNAQTPTGVILPYGGTSAPTGYLLCDGTAVSRTTYAALFGIIGTAYGTGDGSTTFNVPDLRGYVPVGYKSGDSDFGTLGGAVGAKTHTLQVTEIPAHKHSGYYTSGYAIGGAANAMYPTSATDAPNCMTEVGGGGAHNNIQPSKTVNYIIKT
jgi:microcystin-dependent protein